MKIGDIPKSRLSKLNKGLVETSNLTEWLAVDQRKLLKYLSKNLELSELSEIAKAMPDLSVPKQIAWIGKQFSKDTAKKLVDHPSDIVGCWICYSKANGAKTIKSSLSAIKPYAISNHFGLREVAWMAIREKICLEPKKYIEALKPWVKSKNPYQRRFATESTRPRGVWAKHITELKQQPKIGIALLTPLKSDPERYVQDSVANWLNDASKDDPKWVKTITNKWLKDSSSTATKYIVKRATRSIKTGRK